MEFDTFKIKVRNVLGNISFDGHIKKIIKSCDETRINDILGWIENCKNNEERFEPCKKYPDMVAFIENLWSDLKWV